jgi:hypothetical protein
LSLRRPGSFPILDGTDSASISERTAERPRYDEDIDSGCLRLAGSARCEHCRQDTTRVTDGTSNYRLHTVQSL